MNEKEFDELILENAKVAPDALRKRQIDKYREGVNKVYRIPDEIAIIKEGVICALRAISIYHPAIVEDEMYKKAMAYFAEVEKIKEQAKIELGIIKEVAIDENTNV